jgi:hypothetical protein
MEKNLPKNPALVLGLGFANLGFFTYAGIGPARGVQLRMEGPYLLVTGEKERILLGLGRKRNLELYEELKAKTGK